MNYNSFANVDDGSCMYDCSALSITIDSSGNVTGCNGGSNGYIVASVNNISHSLTWLDNGSTSGTRSGLTAGIYTLVAVTPDGMCYDTLNVTITEPASISLISMTGNESALGASDGQIDLTASGGVPCVTAASLSSWNTCLLYTSPSPRD